MTLNEAVEHINGIRPSFGHETNEALDVVIGVATDPGIRFALLDDCERCLRQGCEYRGAEVIRVNCPLMKTSAV